MKKGLFSILAGALLVVGCQNYDDQFDNIETLVNALAQQVAGLSKVQADLTTLAGTVNALQDNIGTEVDAALADGLANIDQAVVDLNAAADNAASAEAVADIAEAVLAQQEDLNAILQASQFFTGDIIISNSADLTTYHNARAGFKIINGNVTITTTADMDMVKLQEMVDAIQQCTKDFTFTADSSKTAEDEIYFNKLTSTASLTISQKGGYELKTLSNAGNISLNYTTSTDIVHLGALTTVLSLQSTGDGAGTFHFKKATEMHLTSLPRYTAGTLSLKVDDNGGVIDISALTDLSDSNVKLELDLTIDGPTSVTVPGLTGDKAGSSLTLLNVATVTLTDYDGAVSIGEEVLNFTSNGLVDLTILSTGTDLVTFDATGIMDPNATVVDKVAPTLNLTGQGKLETVTLTGTFYSATVSNTGASTIDLGGAADALVVQNAITITGNKDLASVDMTGTTASGVVYSTNETLASLTVDATFAAGVSNKGVVATAGINGSISITNNDDLETVEISSTKLENLTVTGNDDLTSLSASGALAVTATAAIGATSEATVSIYNNDLTASQLVDTVDTVTTPAAAVVNGGVSDIGDIVTTSGLATLKAYFTAVDADTDSTANVYFDTVDSFTPETGSEITSNLEWTQALATAGTLPDGIKVLVLTANSADTGTGGVAQKQAYVINGVAARGNAIQIHVGEGATVASKFKLLLGGSQTYATAGKLGMATSGNMILDVGSLIDAQHVLRATAEGVTYDAKVGGYATVSITFSQITSATAAGVTEEHHDTAALLATATATLSQQATATMGSDDYVTLTIGSNSVTATGANTTIDEALEVAWTAKYGPSGTASASGIATVSRSLTTATLIHISMKDKSYNGDAVAVSLTVNSGTVTATSTAGLGWVIGASRLLSDNKSVSDPTAVTILLTSNEVGIINNELKSFTATSIVVSSTQNITRLASTVNDGTNGTTGLIGHASTNEHRTLVVNPVEAISAASSNAVSFSRVGWL